MSGFDLIIRNGTVVDGTGMLKAVTDVGIPSGSIHELACHFEVDRTTVTAHIDRAGIARRRVVRKMTDESVAFAATQYEDGGRSGWWLARSACTNGQWRGNSVEREC